MTTSRKIDHTTEIKIEGKVTLKKIAELAQCSVATVSTALNRARGNSRISPEQAERIKLIAKRLGYHVNYASQCLRKSRTNILGVFIRSAQWHGVAQPYEAMLLSGMQDAASRLGYELLLLNLSGEASMKICEEHIGSKRVDGILMLHIDTNPHDPWVEQLQQFTDRGVILDYANPCGKLCRVAVDDRLAMKETLASLVTKGHRRIGFVAPTITDCALNHTLRKEYFKELVKEFDVEPIIFDGACISKPNPLELEYAQADGRDGLRYFTNLTKPPTAVITYDSFVSIGMLKEAERMGIRLPDEMSIIGYDYSEILRYLSPTLSFIDRKSALIGATAVELLVDLLEGRATPGTLRTIEPSLHETESIKSIL